jgi:hypothetical protein
MGGITQGLKTKDGSGKGKEQAMTWDWTGVAPGTETSKEKNLTRNVAVKKYDREMYMSCDDLF